MPDKFDKFNRASRDFILTQPVDMAAVNKLGWAELNKGAPIVAGVMCHDMFGKWSLMGRKQVAVREKDAYHHPARHSRMIAPIPHPSELCDPANEMNKVVRDASGNVVPPPGWRHSQKGDPFPLIAVYEKHWGKTTLDVGQSKGGFGSDAIAPMHPSLPPFAPVAAEKKEEPKESAKATCVADLSAMNHGQLVAQARLFGVRHVGLTTPDLRGRIAAKISWGEAQPASHIAAPAEKVAAPAPKFKPGDRVRVVRIVQPLSESENSEWLAQEGVVVTPDAVARQDKVWVRFDGHKTSHWFHEEELDLAPSPAPFAWPEFKSHKGNENGAKHTDIAWAGTADKNVCMAQSELDAIAAELARRKSDNARLAARVKELEGNVSSERAIDYRAIRKLCGLDDTAKVGDVMRRIEALAMAEAERDAARADAEKLRDAMGRANDTIEEMQMELATWRAGKALNAELAKTREEFPTIPDPTKEADRGDKS